MQKVRFKVVVSTYNAMPYLERCLRSIACQSYPFFDLCIVDDSSTQVGQQELIGYFCAKYGWTPLFQPKRLGPLHSRVVGIRHFNCDPDEILFLIDGDDWLYDNFVFEKVAAIYETGRYDLTYGQHLEYPRYRLGGVPPLTASVPIRRKVVRERSFRKTPLSAFHPWTFRHFLWASIEDADLRAEGGEYFKAGTDFAFIFPLLEMVGDRFCPISDLLYVHNRDNIINESKVIPLSQGVIEVYIRLKEPYPVHDRCR